MRRYEWNSKCYYDYGAQVATRCLTATIRGAETENREDVVACSIDFAGGTTYPLTIENFPGSEQLPSSQRVPRFTA
jgi:hypothetical protein